MNAPAVTVRASGWADLPAITEVWTAAGSQVVLAAVRLVSGAGAWPTRSPRAGVLCGCGALSRRTCAVPAHHPPCGHLDITRLVLRPIASTHLLAWRP